MPDFITGMYLYIFMLYKFACLCLFFMFWYISSEFHACFSFVRIRYELVICIIVIQEELRCSSWGIRVSVVSFHC